MSTDCERLRWLPAPLNGGRLSDACKSSRECGRDVSATAARRERSPRLRPLGGGGERQTDPVRLRPASELRPEMEAAAER